MYKLFFKPLLDKIVSMIILLFASVLIFIIIILLYYLNNREVFFIQERPGLNSKVFKLIKFKSMNNKLDKNGILLPDELRLTKIGRFLRKTSLDELPQFVNVLLGDMSIIGPRPLLVEYLTFYTDEQNRRHEVRPGITGWAQVNGRNAISWQRKFELDLYYVNNISLMLDIRIIFLTIRKVLIREGINASENDTMSKFDGTN